MPTNQHPFFAHLEALTPASIQFSAGEVLFYQGDPVNMIYCLEEGVVELHRNGILQAESANPFLDEIAVLGGLPHQVKCLAKTDCRLLAWSADVFWDFPNINTLARRYLAEQWQSTQERQHALSAPISYEHGELPSGPFLFDNVTMIFAFCEGDKQQIASLLPPNVSLLQRPKRETAPLLVALADFPHAYRESKQEKPFAYTETTFFVPVRYQTAFGFYVPHIYPSTYEPILLGRDIYGFPKELGLTEFSNKSVSLAVGEENALNLEWGSGVGQDETALVGAVGNWLGLSGRLTGLAFQAGELLRKTARLPATRRVDVYNHKKNPSVDSTSADPRYAVNQLTRCTFGVLRWYQVTQLMNLKLEITGEKFAALGLSIKEAYRTQLDMRLSTGRVVEDYLTK